MYEDDLVLCGEAEEDLRAVVGRFVEVCRSSSLKVNAGKSKVKVLNGEEGQECKASVDGVRLEHVSEFKYNLNTWMNRVQMRHNDVGMWRVGGGLQVLLGL